MIRTRVKEIVKKKDRERYEEEKEVGGATECG